MIFARLQRDLEVCKQERGPKLSDQFLNCIALTAEAMSAEVPIEDARARCPVRALVRKRRVVAVRIPEADERWHLDRVVSDAVLRAILAMADDCTNLGEDGR